MATAADRAPTEPTVAAREPRRRIGRLRWVVDSAIWLGALSVAGSAALHLHLWLMGYRSIPTVGPLFIAQAMAGFVLAALLAWTRRAVLAIVASLFLLATVGGLLMSAWFGLFGFHDSLSAPYAGLSLVVELSGATILVLAGTAKLLGIGRRA